MSPQKRVEIVISQNSPAVFVGEVLYEGAGESGAGKPIRELKICGHWEGKTQKMTITFCTPTCSWKHLPDTVSDS